MTATHMSSCSARGAAHARAMDENVIATTFSEASRAYEALARLKELAAEGQIDLHDAGVVERAQDGTLHLRDEAGDEDDGLATLTGGTIGLLIGILAGPLGVLLGGAVGLLGGAIVDAEDDDETDSVLEHISRSIGNGETAVLADLDESGPAPADGPIDARPWTARWPRSTAALRATRARMSRPRSPEPRRPRTRRASRPARSCATSVVRRPSRRSRRSSTSCASGSGTWCITEARVRSRASQPDHRGARRRPARRRRRDRRGVSRRRGRGTPRQRREPASTRRGGAHRARSDGSARRRRPVAH